MEKRTIEVPAIYEPAGQYNHAIVVSGGRTAYLSGVVGRHKDGSVPAGIVEQTELAFDNLTLPGLRRRFRCFHGSLAGAACED